MSEFEALNEQVVACTRCPRLRRYCLAVAKEKRKAFLDWSYWGKPVPGFGDPDATLWIVGLAPAAHGANRTGRVFTGDRSGDFLFASLHRTGYSNQPTSSSRDDGLVLRGCYISAAVRCAPPANKPMPVEASNCAGYLDAEWHFLKKKRVILALGKIAWDACLSMCLRKGIPIATPRPRFGHGIRVVLKEDLSLLGSYHVSQQNTFTGKLTTEMFDEVLTRAGSL